MSTTSYYLTLVTLCGSSEEYTIRGPTDEINVRECIRNVLGITWYVKYWYRGNMSTL